MGKKDAKMMEKGAKRELKWSPKSDQNGQKEPKGHPKGQKGRKKGMSKSMLKSEAEKNRIEAGKVQLYLHMWLCSYPFRGQSGG